MKRLSTIMICLFAMTMASLSAKAQEITIYLMPGWNWISYTNAVSMDIDEALGDFVPMEGDMLKSKYSSTKYSNGQWRGRLEQFTPGLGYHYYSNRGEPVSFVFASTAPQLTVTTVEPTEITATSAISGGSITSNDGSYVFVLEKGICWATHPNPMVMNDSFTQNGNGPDSFTSEMTDLTPNTVYYVRAYAVTLDGTTYGDELSFNTQRWINGVLPGLFSVSENQQVHFSQGNLQYLGSVDTPYWRFAENQWDFFGTTTGQNSNNHNVDRDLFSWGTSGCNHGANCYQPWSTSTSTNDYFAYGSSTYNLYDQTGQADWGYNPISNGGNQVNQWRTLTHPEWAYVFNTRTTSSGIRYAKANVSNVNGVILLPDDWSTSYYTLSNTNSTDASFSSNTISATQWSTLEQHGAVFLPAAGDRHGTSVRFVGSFGNYWSASRSIYYSYDAGLVGFSDSSLSPYGNGRRSFGDSVRLVRDAE